MSFTIALFWCFTFGGILIYYLIPSNIRWVWLLIISYLYYLSFGKKNIVFLIFASVVVYIGALIIEKIQRKSDEYISNNKAELDKEQKKKKKNITKHKKRVVLVVAMLLNFGILAVIKYGKFVLLNISSITGAFGINATWGLFGKIAMPIGLSFFTFQSVSYLIDVYQGKYKAERNLFKICLFVSFFPQIMQGPIGRYDRLKTTLFTGNTFQLKNIQHGLQRVLWGFFKKLILADRAGVFVNYVFLTPDNYGGAMCILAVLMYSIQLYMDFSGGIDIVIGVAQMFGVSMDENFRQPYFSRSIGEFWRRWHITLGTWMKDYIFYPFCLSRSMNKLGKWGKKHLGKHLGTTIPICLSNLLIFFVVGVWHGAEWRYIIYGMYNGIIIAFSNLMEPVYKFGLKKCHINQERYWWKIFQIVRTFILVNIGWVFDCSVAGVGSAFRMISRMFTDLRLGQLNSDMFIRIGLVNMDYIILAIGCLIVFIISVLKEKGVQIREKVDTKPIALRWTIYYLLIVIIFVFGYVTDTGSGFLYANF